MTSVEISCCSENLVLEFLRDRLFPIHVWVLCAVFASAGGVFKRARCIFFPKVSARPCNDRRFPLHHRPENTEVSVPSSPRYAKNARRRYAIEVHLNFSEAPHLRSSIRHPKSFFSKNRKSSWRITPWPKSTKRFFRNQDLGKETPSFRNKIAEMCYLYRGTGPRPNLFREWWNDVVPMADSG